MGRYNRGEEEMRFAVDFIYISNPFTEKHRGIDLGWGSDKNQPVFAVCSGTIIYSKFQESGGYVLHIKHDNGFCSEYAHLQKGSIRVKVGDRVELGQQIANMGNTGKAKGYHLHLGIYKGAYINYSVDNWVNPIKYLEYYEDQVVYGPTMDKYKLKKHEGEPEPHKDWTTGKYEILVAKTIRTSCKLTPSNRVKVKDCTPATKRVLTSTKPNDIAMVKIGAIITISEIYTDKSNRIWGKYGNCWIVICNADGTPQAERQ